MNTLEIKGARVRKNLTQASVAEKLGMKQTTYSAKENGRSKFSDKEKIALANLLELTPDQINDFLYDGMLPIYHSDISRHYR